MVRPARETNEQRIPRIMPAFSRCESGERRLGRTEQQACQIAPSAMDVWKKMIRAATLPERIQPIARRTDARACPTRFRRRQAIRSLHLNRVPTSPPCRRREDVLKRQASEFTPPRTRSSATTRKTASQRPSDKLPSQNREGSPATSTSSCAQLRPE